MKIIENSLEAVQLNLAIDLTLSTIGDLLKRYDKNDSAYNSLTELSTTLTIIKGRVKKLYKE